MAQQWIKVRDALFSDVKLISMARFLNRHPGFVAKIANPEVVVPGMEVVGAQFAKDPEQACDVVTSRVTFDVTAASLLRVWMSANSSAKIVVCDGRCDAVFKPCQLSDLDTIGGYPGIGEAMAYVGWAIVGENSVTLPNFVEYNVPAESRDAVSGVERTRRWRAKKKRKKSAPRSPPRDADVTKCDGVTLDKMREDEMREDDDNNNTIGSSKDGAGVVVVGSSDSRSAEEGKSAPAEPPPTAAEAELAAVYERLVGHAAGGYRLHVGHEKAWEWARRGMTLEDLDEWLEYESARGTKLARHYMATFNTPTDIPQILAQAPQAALSDEQVRRLAHGVD